MRDLIAFGGGGKGSSGATRVAQEAADTLRSQAFAKVLDLVCEGPIKGLVNGFESIFLDGTPLQNADGSLNFQGVGVDYRLGTQAQSYITGFAQTESEIAVSIQVKAAVPVVRTVSSSTLVNAIRVTVSTPHLTEQNTSNGDLNGSSVTLAIDLDSGGGFVQKITDTISGKTTSNYQRNYTVEVDGPGPFTIRVRRLTPDSISTAIQNDTYFDSYTLIEDGKLRYPNSAIIATMVDASQFQSIPTRAFDLYLREIQVPSNYDPVNRTYTGVWDGTFKISWTDNPAWCWLDIVTSTRFGLGRFVNLDIVDKWALYQISQYCDQMVPDGKGGLEPRFTCNLYLQTRDEAYKVVNNMASVFRGITYWGSSLLSPVQDAPTDPVALFTPANVVGGTFSYTGTDLTTRHTVAVVQWNDPSDDYKQKFEYVEGEVADIERYGVIQTEIIAMGCTSQGQANRVGRWALYTEANETEAIAFSVPLEGALARPGQIIQVQDPSRASLRLGGRVLDSTVNLITVDASINIEVGKSYTISCVLPDAPIQNPQKPKLPGLGLIETRNITNTPGLTSAIQVDQPFSQAPQQFATWIIAVNDLVPQIFRVLGVVEDSNNSLQYDITGVSHNPSKFNHVDLGTPLQNAPISIKALTVPSPIDVAITQHEHTDSLGVTLVLSIGWIQPAAGLTYSVDYRRNNGNWITIGSVAESTVDIPGNSLPGDYQARVVSVNVANKSSVASISPVYTLVGKSDKPPGLSSLIAKEDLWAINLFLGFAPNQPDLLSTEIWVSLTNDRAQASLLGTLSYPKDTAVESGLPNDIYHYYWGRCQNTSLVYSEWFPVDPLAGVQGHTLGTAGKILTLLSGKIAGSNAGKTIGERLDQIDASTGFSSQITSVQSDYQSLYSLVNSIGARLNAPYGDIASAISRIESAAAVTKPTPYQAVAPENPAFGDAWYDSTYGGVLRFWNGSAWLFASDAITQPTAPENPSVGELWRDNSTPQQYYRLWNGTQWINTARATIYSPTQPATYGIAVGDTWKNTSDNSFWVFDGTIWVDTQNSDVAAIASQVTALQTTVGNYSTQIQQNISSVGGLSGLYSVKIDNNGYLSGFALSSTLLPGGTGPISDFVIDVNRFAVGDSSTSPTYPFIITGGTTYIKDALIGTAAVDTLKIAGNAVTIPASSYAPASIPLTGNQQQVAILTVNYGAFAPAAVEILFVAGVSNGGGANGATQTWIYRDGQLIFSGQDAIVNNIGANKAIHAFQDNPGPGTHTYTVNCNYAGNISSAAILSRFLSVIGSLR